MFQDCGKDGRKKTEKKTHDGTMRRMRAIEGGTEEKDERMES